MFGDAAESLRKAGDEYGAKTGRPRRVGAMDLVATAYGIEVQAATEIALTKLDVLSNMEQIPVCVASTLNGKTVHRFPFPAALNAAAPVIEYKKGWMQDISRIRRWEELPEAAREYVTCIENAVGRPIRYISVGPERDSIIIR